MSTTHLPTSLCLRCAAVLDAATSTKNEARPRPGDLTVCLYCAEVYVFDDRLVIRVATADDLASLDPDVVGELTRAVRIVKARCPS